MGTQTVIAHEELPSHPNPQPSQANTGYPSPPPQHHATLSGPASFSSSSSAIATAGASSQNGSLKFSPPTTPPPKAKKAGGKGAKKQLTPEELNSMIHSKISQLEEETAHEEEEEQALANAVKKANKEITQVIDSEEADKLTIVHQKYMEIFQEMKRLERDNGKMRKQTELVRKERDAAKSDLSKANSMKHKLETVCRELQKENKRIKVHGQSTVFTICSLSWPSQEESKKLALSEQQKREELSSKFETTIWEIKSKMEEDTDEKRKRQEDSEQLVMADSFGRVSRSQHGSAGLLNLEFLSTTFTLLSRLKEKFKSFLEQYELREKHFNCVVKSKDLELQLYDAKLEQQKQLTEQETMKAEALRQQIAAFAKTEAELRKQLNVYVDKFRQVEETLNKSNELFLTFRKEMEQVCMGRWDRWKEETSKEGGGGGGKREVVKALVGAEGINDELNDEREIYSDTQRQPLCLFLVRACGPA
ncbi:myosin-like coiled-coil protein-domain-containing protein [Endogone sp. FLAS-F59071]|nr:myosin-like coiled-coil protein-domain-containing protein [Endogone sp. FLAS-F59071]|eukprot:RUS15291.1 myosin-like coiled-coil protein-domain-containing protein [Endogone sp. FLAS-F59071]